MDIRPLAISGAFEVTPRQHGDVPAGSSSGSRLRPSRDVESRLWARRTAPCRRRRRRRGIHFSDVPPGQAKYVTCVASAVIDIVVDIRVGSPTFGTWDSVVLDGAERRAVYLSEGLGHAFMSLAEGSTVVYLCSTPYAPERERGIHPLDPELGIAWPTHDRTGRQVDPILSEKDMARHSSAGRPAWVCCRRSRRCAPSLRRFAE